MRAAVERRWGRAWAHARIVLCAALWVVSSRAQAHDPPEVHRLLWRPGARGASELVMVTNRGLIMADLEKRSFRLMCNEAVGVNSSERPDLALLDGGRMLIASSAGVQSSSDGGCNWQGLAPFATTTAPALAQDPRTPATLYLAIFETGNSGVHVTRDGGTTFERVLQVADNDFIQELRVSTADPSVVYASGETFDSGGKFAHYVARSTDSGKSWERFAAAVLATESDLELLTLHPADPQWLVAKTIARNPAADPERLLISRDAGRTFAQVFSAERIYDAGFGTDGETLWVGTRMALFRSADRGRTFEKIAGPQVLLSCVSEHAGALWACGYFGNGSDGLSTSNDGGNAFQTRMDFAEVTSPVACPDGSATARVCATLWSDWEREILGAADGTAGGGGALNPPAGVGGAFVTPAGGTGGSGAAQPATQPADAGACSLGPAVGSPTPAGALTLVGLFAALLRRVRVHRTRQRR